MTIVSFPSPPRRVRITSSDGLADASLVGTVVAVERGPEIIAHDPRREISTHRPIGRR